MPAASLQHATDHGGSGLSQRVTLRTPRWLSVDVEGVGDKKVGGICTGPDMHSPGSMDNVGRSPVGLDEPNWCSVGSPLGSDSCGGIPDDSVCDSSLFGSPQCTPPCSPKPPSGREGRRRIRRRADQAVAPANCCEEKVVEDVSSSQAPCTAPCTPPCSPRAPGSGRRRRRPTSGAKPPEGEADDKGSQSVPGISIHEALKLRRCVDDDGSFRAVAQATNTTGATVLPTAPRDVEPDDSSVDTDPDMPTLIPAHAPQCNSTPNTSGDGISRRSSGRTSGCNGLPWKSSLPCRKLFEEESSSEEPCESKVDGIQSCLAGRCSFKGPDGVLNNTIQHGPAMGCC